MIPWVSVRQRVGLTIHWSWLFLFCLSFSCWRSEFPALWKEANAFQFRSLTQTEGLFLSHFTETTQIEHLDMCGRCLGAPVVVIGCKRLKQEQGTLKSGIIKYLCQNDCTPSTLQNRKAKSRWPSEKNQWQQPRGDKLSPETSAPQSFNLQWLHQSVSQRLGTSPWLLGLSFQF